jgi:hypothetical protein
MSNTAIKIFALGLIVLAGTFTGSAASALSGTSIGALGGVANLNNNGGSPFTYGLDIASKSAAWTFGATYNYLSANSTPAAGASSPSLSNLYAHLEIQLGELGVGALAGYNWLSNSSPGASTGSNFIYGALAHWDFAFGSSFSIGPRVDVIWNNGSNTFNETDIIGVVKFWF